MSTTRAAHHPADHPAHDTTAAHLERTVALLGAGNAATPEHRLEAAAEAVRGTPWKSYRAGRVRLAGLIGMYWEWLRPGADSRFVGRTGVPVAWRSDDNVVAADAFVCDSEVDDEPTAERVRTLAMVGQSVFGDSFSGVRVIVMRAPTSSLFVGANGDASPLADTRWAFATGASNG